MYKENNFYSYDEKNPFHIKKLRNKRESQELHLQKTNYLLRMSASLVDLYKNDERVIDYSNDLANPYFGEVIFKSGCKLYTGYFTDDSVQWLYNKKIWRSKETTERLGEPRDGFTEEHWIPRTTVGKIIVDALIYGKDEYDVFNGDTSLESVHNWIDNNTALFCSIIIASKSENDQLNTEIEKNHYTFPQLLNLDHYRSLGITLHKNNHFKFNKYCKPGGTRKTNMFGASVKEQKENFELRNQNWSFPTLDDSHFFPSIITPAMQELDNNNQERIAA